MKRFLLITCILLLPLSAWAGKNVQKTQLASFISEYRHCEGVELVQLGTFATAAVRAMVRLGASDDEDSRQAISMLKGIRRLTVLDYEDAPDSIKEKMSRRLDRILNGSELLMEAKDGDDVMKMYGVLDKKGENVSDFVLYTPGDCALICIFGKVSMKAIAEIMKEND